MSDYQQIPPPPSHLPETPEFPQKSRYRRPRSYISWIGLLLGIVLGIGGGLYYAWNLMPAEEFDTGPWQLSAEDKAQYAIAIMLRYSYNADLDLAVNDLLELQLGDDPIQEVANIACNLARTDYIDSNAGLNGVLALRNFYQLQGRSGCADNLIPDAAVAPVITIVVPTSTPTLVPPPTKTATPSDAMRSTPTPSVEIVPTTPPQRDFTLVNIETFCDVQLSGLIEVYVQEYNGDGVPGEAVRVRWSDGEDTFFTGLKSERGPAYADFQMEEETGYIIDMPGRSNPSSSQLVAVQCYTESGQESLRSYRVVFRPAG